MRAWTKVSENALRGIFKPDTLVVETSWQRDADGSLSEGPINARSSIPPPHEVHSSADSGNLTLTMQGSLPRETSGSIWRPR